MAQNIIIEEEIIEDEIQMQEEPINVFPSGGAVYSVNGKVGNVILATSVLANTSGYQTASDVASAIATATAIIEGRLDAVDAQIDNITALIPNQASASNQLADKEFVNSSVSTNTAYFLGTYDTLAELESVADPTNNDYGFVISTDAAGNTVYNRYKYNGDDGEWLFEYAFNNSSFTAAQWAAIQSGITPALVQQISDNASTIAGLATVATSGSYNDLTNKPTIPEAYTLPAATSSTLGGVKVGDGLSVEEDGTLSATGGSGGAITILTADDYDYPASDPVGVAAWLLDDGLYKIDPSSSSDYTIYASTVDTQSLSPSGTFEVVTMTSSMKRIIFQSNTQETPIIAYQTTISGGRNVILSLLSTKGVVNNLSENWGWKALSAAQGKVLNEKIGDLTTLDTADQSSVVAAINEVASSGGGGTLYDGLGTNTDGAMTQKAVTDTLFADGATARRVKIGNNTSTSGSFNVTVGYGATTVEGSIALGINAKATGNYSMALGYLTNTNYQEYSVALGRAAKPTRTGEVNIGTPTEATKGYNGTAYRILGGVHAGELDTDAVNKKQMDDAIAALEARIAALEGNA